jgi:hypothetical protein
VGADTVELTVPVSPTNGGTGRTNLPYQAVVMSNGPSAMLGLTAAMPGNVLVADGALLPNFGQVNLASPNAVTGILPPARLGSGTPSAATYLRGDSTWATPAGGGGGGTDTHTVATSPPASPVAGDVWLDTTAVAADMVTQAELDAALALLTNPPRARAYRTTVQAIVNATVTKVVFNAAEYNTGGALGGVVWNSAEAMVCPRSGLYQFGAFAVFDPATSGVARRSLWIQMDGAARAIAITEMPALAGMYPSPNPTGEYRWTVGQACFCYAYQESGVTLNLSNAAFWCRYICD